MVRKKFVCYHDCSLQNNSPNSPLECWFGLLQKSYSIKNTLSLVIAAEDGKIAAVEGQLLTMLAKNYPYYASIAPALSIGQLCPKQCQHNLHVPSGWLEAISFYGHARVKQINASSILVLIVWFSSCEELKSDSYFHGMPLSTRFKNLYLSPT